MESDAGTVLTRAHTTRKDALKRALTAQGQGLPRFRCTTCGKTFNRRTGTPFWRNHPQGERRQRELIRYLGLPLPTVQIAEVLQAEDGIAARLISEFRQRCDQLDPSGQLVSRIRVGVRPTEDSLCLHCGAQSVRFDAPGPGHCVNCGRVVSMRRPILERDGLLEVGPLEWDITPHQRSS